ncbi:hypothetical protein [Flavobacterium sp.]|jgi:hypothetical protein|uniref:hypothetical protein n=1 Tax=Flavobacterium sp. TaxID=239 RepID=UPI0037BE4B93
MKRIIILVLAFFSLMTNAQTEKVDSLQITANNVNGFLIKEFENKSAKEIYSSLKKWTQYNINNADYATNSDIENEYLSFTINGVGEIRYKQSKQWLFKLNLYVEVRIKENKMRLDIVVKRIAGQGHDDISINGGMNSLFKSNGEPRNSTETYRIDVDKSLNNFANEVFSAINGKLDYKKSDW